MDNNIELYRAHSRKYLDGVVGVIANPNLARLRQPRDMPAHVHGALNEWFISNYGVSFRETALFCTGDQAVATGYVFSGSRLIRIAPVGNYSVCYSALCKDLFARYQFNWGPRNFGGKEIHDDLDLLDYRFFKNDGLEAAASSGNEVMLYAESFRYECVNG